MSEVDALLKRAEESFNKRNYDYARDLYLTVLAKDPNHELAHKGLYATCLRKNQEQGGPGKLKLMGMKTMIMGQLQTAKNNPQKRIDITLKYLVDDPTNAGVRTQLASGLRDLGKWVGAAIEAEIAFATDQKNVEAAKIVVEAKTQLGKVDEAEAILQKVSGAAAEDRDIERLRRDLAARKSAGVFNKGTDDYRNVIKDKEHAAQLEKNTQLVKTDEDFEAVMSHLKGELESNPSDVKTVQKIAQLYFDYKKDWKTAKEWFSKAAEISPQDSVLRDKIEDCELRLWDARVAQAEKSGDAKLAEIKAGRLKAMMSSYQRRVADRPTDMGLRFELGKAYFLAGGTFLDKAIGEFQQAVKDPKKKIDSHRYLGAAFQKKKLYDMADAQYQKAEDAGILNQTVLLDVWYNRAKCLYEAGKKPTAIDFGKKIMEQDIGYKDISALVEKWNSEG